MAGPIPRGRICWHELLTTDPDAAARFYPKVTGWGVVAWDQDTSYRMWTVGETPVGGLMALPEDAKRMGAPSNWLWYGSTPDLDSTVQQALALGAKALSGMIDVPNVGRMAVMSDPQGATFAAYQPAGDTPGHDGKPAMGEISWHELATTDWKAAFDFYRALFGWERMNAMEGPTGTYLMFGRVGTMLGGIYDQPPEMPAPPHWLCYARVPDAPKAVSLVTRQGGKLLNGPMAVAGGDMIAQCMDPQGAAFAVHAVAAAAAKPKAVAPKKKATKAKTVAAKRKTAKKKPARAKAARRKPAKRKPARRAAKARKPLRRKKKTAKRSRSRKGRRR